MKKPCPHRRLGRTLAGREFVTFCVRCFTLLDAPAGQTPAYYSYGTAEHLRLQWRKLKHG